MTNEELAAIEARADAATPLPWKLIEGDDIPSRIEAEDWRIDLIINTAEAWHSFNFIAHARTDIPALVAEVKRLQSGLSIIESRWREASQDKCFRSHYRGTMAECADELRYLLTGGDDAKLQAEIDKAFEAGEL